jgi:phosphoribosylformylglycinamidine (FGAM) synthase-like enzyme
VQAATREIVRAGLVESAHDLSDGGLAMALAECSFGGIGAKIAVRAEMRPEFLLFHEGPSRVLVSTARPGDVEEIAKEHGIESLRIGMTVKDRLQIIDGSATLVDVGIAHLCEIWEHGLEKLLAVEHG